MSELTRTASLLFTSGGVIVFLFLLFKRRSLSTALPFALDFWMGAGLLKLAGDPAWSVVATVGAIVIVRKLVVFRLKLIPL